MNERKMSTRLLVTSAIITALVVLLQAVGASIKLGPFSISLVLIPIVIGTATCGWKIGAWLGFVFGLMVLISGDANLFLAVNVPGTIITVMVKGILAGLAAGLVYKLVAKFNRYIAVVSAAVVCPVVNTGIFLLGSVIFFMETVNAGALAEGLSAGAYLIIFFVGLNFVFELLVNVVLSPALARIIDIIGKRFVKTPEKPIVKSENNSQ